MAKKTDITRYIKRMGTLYLVWFVIELPYVFCRFFMTDRPFLIQLIIFIKQLLFQNTFGASWYITASVEAMLLIWFLDKKKVSQVIVWIIALLLYSLSCLSSLYFGLIDGTVFATALHYLSYILPPHNTFFVAVIYMLVGKFIAEHPTDINTRWYLALGACIVLGVVEVVVCKSSCVFNDSFLALVPITYFLVRILITKTISVKDSISKFFRGCSTLVYFIHAYILFWAMGIGKMEQGYMLFVVVLFSSVFLSAVLYLLSRRFKALKYLY